MRWLSAKVKVETIVQRARASRQTGHIKAGQLSDRTVLFLDNKAAACKLIVRDSCVYIWWWVLDIVSS